MQSPLRLFIISGPSGAGEDSIIEGLKKTLPIERVITTTTREPREGETNGNPYYFRSREAFEQGISGKEFVEYAQEYNGNFYGVTKEEIERILASGKIGIWKIEWKGVITAKKIFPEIKAIFIGVENLDILERRIRRRNPNVSEEYIRDRMEYTREWMNHLDIYDYTVINKEGLLEQAIKEIEQIIQDNINQK